MRAASRWKLGDYRTRSTTNQPGPNSRLSALFKGSIRRGAA
jgi:hypothetical protein